MNQHNTPLNQHNTPLKDALEEFLHRRVVPFDVPGHKRGRGTPELTAFLGERCMNLDVNSMKPLDNWTGPVSVIRDAERLAADAFVPNDPLVHAFFMVGGTTAAVQNMIFSSCKKGDKIILPRNVHRSVINAMVLCGAVPVYVNPGASDRLGIPLAAAPRDIEAAVAAHPDAKAVLVNNPTYYGVCTDIAAAVKIAHDAGMLLLADEAHGTHFYFGENLPAPAMRAGADMAAVSMHKSGGSLTQSSILLMRENDRCPHKLSPGYVRQVTGLTGTTSASYILLVSLDIARMVLATRGKRIFARVSELAEYGRNEINEIGDYYAFGREITDSAPCADTAPDTAAYGFDITKLSVNTVGVGLAGIEVYDLLRDEYDIQLEFGDIGNILAYVSVGDRERDIERLVGALSEVRRRYKKPRKDMLTREYINPQVLLAPQEAFYSDKAVLSLKNCIGRVCAEFVMCYPPGIPILAPGELVTADIVEYIVYAKAKGCFVTGAQDSSTETLRVVV
ncbi:arginine decarboxylase [Clostridia bacterium]|nr:arginine decarboxylase [Clostridia bacterium]